MLHTGEVGLRRIGEQPGASPRWTAQMPIELLLIDAHIRQHDRYISHGGMFRPRELANAVDGVVIVEREKVFTPLVERI
jgi:hypothetical protein